MDKFERQKETARLVYTFKGAKGNWLEAQRIAEQICQLFEPKPDKLTSEARSGALTPYEISQIEKFEKPEDRLLTEIYDEWLKQGGTAGDLQLKTASIYQKKIEEIFEEIEKQMPDSIRSNSDWWQVFKSQYLPKPK